MPPNKTSGPGAAL
jgi:vacuolar-type H+-ATPase subunit I/STV1